MRACGVSSGSIWTGPNVVVPFSATTRSAGSPAVTSSGPAIFQLVFAKSAGSQ